MMMYRRALWILCSFLPAARQHPIGRNRPFPNNKSRPDPSHPTSKGLLGFVAAVSPTHRTLHKKSFPLDVDDRDRDRNGAAKSTCSSELCQAAIENVETNKKGSFWKLDSWFHAGNAYSAYHLLWSPGMWPKIVVSSAALFVSHILLMNIPHHAGSVHGGGSTTNLWTWMPPTISNVILPLLASACCWIQMGLNVMATGCAGFNTILGPVRPYFVSLLIYLTFVTREHQRHWWQWTAFRWCMALTPEVLHFWNVYKERKLQGSNNNNNNPHQLSLTLSETLKETHLSANEGLISATLHVEVPTMGCVACIQSIDSALMRTPGVKQAAAALHPLGIKGGTATIQVQVTSWNELHDARDAILASIDKAGFPGSIVRSEEIHGTGMQPSS